MTKRYASQSRRGTKNWRGLRALHCIVSGRLLLFSQPNALGLGETPVVPDVMTNADDDSKDRKLC